MSSSLMKLLFAKSIYIENCCDNFLEFDYAL